MRIFTFFLAMIFLETGACHAQMAADSHVESKLMALELVARVQAPHTNNVRVLGDILDDTYVCVSAEGRLQTKTELLANLQATGWLEIVTNSMVVRLQGDTAIITGRYWIRGVERGKPFVRRGRFVDTWLYRDERWVAISSLSTPSAN